MSSLQSRPYSHLRVMSGTMLALFAITTSACAGKHALQASDVRPARASAGQPIQFVRVFHSQNSLLSNPYRAVIRDSAEFARLWNTIRRGVSLTAPAPVVDFSRVMLIVVATGDQPTLGSDVQIDSVTREGLSIAVFDELTASGCLSAAAVATPIDIVSVPKAFDPLIFVERYVRTDCS